MIDCAFEFSVLYIRLFVQLFLNNIWLEWQNSVSLLSKTTYNSRTRAIITRGLYTFYPLFEVQKRFFKELFSGMVSIQEWFLIKSGL